MNGGLRCFVALVFPENLGEATARYFAREGQGVTGVRWTDGPHVHLTLKFLGAIASESLPAVCAALATGVAEHGPFTMTLRGAGVFPSLQRPRVVWIGVGAGGAEATLLAGSVERALAPLGFKTEQRAFTPHLTVGRVKTPGTACAGLRRLIPAIGDRVWGETVVPAVHLVRSELFPAGPIYSILHTTRLPDIPRQGR